MVAPVMLITGAAAGIGATIARTAATRGWRVVMADTDARGSSLAEEIGSAARFVDADTGAEADVTYLVNSVREHERRLDALICNAGVMLRKPLGATSLAEWNGVLATNLTSTFLLARAAEDLLRSARGSITTIASTRAHMSEPDTFAYSATKGGLVALTHALAISLGPDVRANCVSPGWIDTKGETLRPLDHSQHPAGRVGTPDDVANLVIWLSREEAKFVTGAEFVIDGGMTRKMIYAE